MLRRGEPCVRPVFRDGKGNQWCCRVLRRGGPLWPSGISRQNSDGDQGVVDGAGDSSEAEVHVHPVFVCDFFGHEGDGVGTGRGEDDAHVCAYAQVVAGFVCDVCTNGEGVREDGFELLSF